MRRMRWEKKGEWLEIEWPNEGWGDRSASERERAEPAVPAVKDGSWEHEKRASEPGGADAGGTRPERPDEWPIELPDKLLRRLEAEGGIRFGRGRISFRLFPAETPQFEPVWTPPDILYEDALCLVVLKPADLPVHPSASGQTDTLAHRVAGYYTATGQACKVRHIHRLDEDTTGPVLYAKCEWAHVWLDARMREKRIERIYEAIVHGRPRPLEGTVDAPIGRDRHHPQRRRVSRTGEPAVTRYRTLESFRDAALVEQRLETGRTHQIRVHMSHLGHPLVGDPLYGGRRSIIGRQALHGRWLRFPHPVGGGIVEVEAARPDDFAHLLKALRSGAAAGSAGRS